MFSTSKRMNKIQIALNVESKTNSTWSSPFSLESADGIIQLKEVFVKEEKLESSKY